MNRLKRIFHHGPALFCTMALFGGIVLLAFAVHPLAGLAVLAGVGLLAAWGQRSINRDWSPDVQGENAYQILGVRQRANAAEIRRAFRRLEQQLHPDRAPPDRKAEAEAAFIRVGQAYELLSDQEKRFQYDKLLEDLEGRIPPFDEAYLDLKDEDKHPIYAAYDEYVAAQRESDSENDNEDECGEDHAVLQAHSPDPVTVETPLDVGPDRSDSAPPPGVPEEVAMPAAIREALGLPADTLSGGTARECKGKTEPPA
jgi:hypothetical protein